MDQTQRHTLNDGKYRSTDICISCNHGLSVRGGNWERDKMCSPLKTTVINNL